MKDLLEQQIATLLNTSDADLAAAICAKSARQVMSEFCYALSQLVIRHVGTDVEITTLSVNFHGGLLRVDLARLTDDKQHLEAWLLGLNANPADQDFGAAVPLPSVGRAQ